MPRPHPRFSGPGFVHAFQGIPCGQPRPRANAGSGSSPPLAEVPLQAEPVAPSDPALLFSESLPPSRRRSLVTPSTAALTGRLGPALCSPSLLLPSCLVPTTRASSPPGGPGVQAPSPSSTLSATLVLDGGGEALVCGALSLGPRARHPCEAPGCSQLSAGAVPMPLWSPGSAPVGAFFSAQEPWLKNRDPSTAFLVLTASCDTPGPSGLCWVCL